MLSNADAALPMPPFHGMPSFSAGLSVADIDPLMQSEARFKALALASGQIYWVADAQGYPVDVSAWCAFTGLTPQEASGTGWIAAIHPDDRARVLADWADALASRRPICHEHRLRRADGQYRTVLVQAYPALTPDGTVSQWVGVDTDITLLQELRADVQASQEEFRATFEQAAAGIAHVRLDDGRLLRVNQKLCEILDYSSEELQQHTFQDLTYPPDLSLNLEMFERLLAGEISTYTIEKRYIRKNGSLIWANLTASLKRDRSGRPEYGIAVVEDISARKALEAELHRRLHEWETIFASMHDGLLVFGPDQKLLRANPAFRSLVGWPADSPLYSMSWQERTRTLQVRNSQGELLTPEQLPLKHVFQGQAVAEEHIIKNRQGHDVHVSMRGTPLIDTAGHILGAILVFQDITERRRLERQATAYTRELETIFASMNDALIVFRADGTILRTNPAYMALVGWPANSAFYRSMSAAERRQALQLRDSQGNPITPDMGPLPLERMLRGESVAEERILRNRLDRDVYVSMRGAPLIDASGRVEGAVLVLRDITEQHRLEQQTQAALRALLRMAELLVQHPTERETQRPLLVGQHLAELACSLLDCPVATIVTLDPETLEMEILATVGYTPAQEAHLNSIISNWLHSPPDRTQIQRLKAGETLALDVTQPPYQQDTAPLEVSQAIVAPMRLRGHLIGLLIFNPHQLAQTFTEQQIALAGATAQLVGLVIERERLLREREDARAHALALHEWNRQMDTFLSMVSHELRTPLASMKLSVQLTQRRLNRALKETSTDGHKLLAPLSALQELLAPAERQIIRLERLIKDLLDASRIKEGKLELRLKRANLNAIVCDVVAQQRELAPERAIQMQTPPDQPLLVRMDEDLIRQAIANYLSNALKYSPETTPVLVGVEREARWARVWVRDQGPGIPLADQERIWDRFQRVPGIRELADSAGGLGLGLYVTKMIVERHHGHVGMHSTPGAGATFWFTLPLA